MWIRIELPSTSLAFYFARLRLRSGTASTSVRQRFYFHQAALQFCSCSTSTQLSTASAMLWHSLRRDNSFIFFIEAIFGRATRACLLIARKPCCRAITASLPARNNDVSENRDVGRQGFPFLSLTLGEVIGERRIFINHTS